MIFVHMHNFGQKDPKLNTGNQLNNFGLQLATYHTQFYETLLKCLPF